MEVIYVSEIRILNEVLGDNLEKKIIISALSEKLAFNIDLSHRENLI